MYDMLQQYLPVITSAFVAALVIWTVSLLVLKYVADEDVRKLVKGARFVLLMLIVIFLAVVFIKAMSVEAVPRSTIDRSAGDEAQQSLNERISTNNES